ncbi:hypothetical protein RB199_00035 [Streptomyces libani]
MARLLQTRTAQLGGEAAEQGRVDLARYRAGLVRGQAGGQGDRRGAVAGRRTVRLRGQHLCGEHPFDRQRAAQAHEADLVERAGQEAFQCAHRRGRVDRGQSHGGHVAQQLVGDVAPVAPVDDLDPAVQRLAQGVGARVLEGAGRRVVRLVGVADEAHQ